METAAPTPVGTVPSILPSRVTLDELPALFEPLSEASRGRLERLHVSLTMLDNQLRLLEGGVGQTRDDMSSLLLQCSEHEARLGRLLISSRAVEAHVDSTSVFASERVQQTQELNGAIEQLLSTNEQLKTEVAGYRIALDQMVLQMSEEEGSEAPRNAFQEPQGGGDGDGSDDDSSADSSDDSSDDDNEQ